MQVREAMRRRRMIRSFASQPLDRETVDDLLLGALRAPTAGNTRGAAWLALTAPEETAVYWRWTTTPQWRDRSRRFPGLSRAPVVALSLVEPDAYRRRYAEDDKRRSGLGADGTGGGDTGGGGAEAWPVPYWFGDAAFSTMALLLGATDCGLGACFLGNFRGEPGLLGALGVPPGWRLFGAVLLGRPDGLDHRSASLDRTAAASGLHHGRWSSSQPRSVDRPREGTRPTWGGNDDD